MGRPVRLEAVPDPALEITLGDPRQKLSERRVRGLLRGRAAAAEDGRGRVTKALRALEREARLPDARGSEDRDEVGPALAGGALERFHDLLELALAADDRRLEAAEQRCRRRDPPPRRPRSRRAGSRSRHGAPGATCGDPASTWPADARSRRLAASSTGGPDTSGSPVTTSPVASPIRAAEPSARAARAACSASSSRAAGTPKTPSRRPLPRLCTVAPWVWSTRSAAALRSRSSARRASGSSDRSSGVTSAASTVTVLRSSARSGRAGGGSTPAGASRAGSRRSTARWTLLELAARLRPELVDEGPPSLHVRLERVRLPTGAVERDDQLAPKALAVRVPGDELLELGHQRCVPADREIGLDPLLERGVPELLEVRRGVAGGLAGEVGERRAAPERQRLGEALGRNRRLGTVRVVDESHEAVEVELAVVDTQQVPRRSRDEPLAELLPQAAEVVLKRRKRGRRRGVAPDALDEPVDGDNAVRVEQEQRQHRPPPRAAESAGRARRRAPPAGRGS